jgi:allantoinase
VVHISSPEACFVLVEGRHAVYDPTIEPPLITGETCPHYVALTEEDVIRLGAPAKCAPPQRDRHRADWLHSLLANGGIDLVASDHSPAPASMKQGRNFFQVWGGISGIQSTLAILLSSDWSMPASRVADLIATRAAERFGIRAKGLIHSGRDADLALIDLDETYELTRDMLLDRHKLSPYVGRTFRGVVKRTIVRGHTVFQDGKIVAGEFRGRLVKPERARKAGAS